MSLTRRAQSLVINCFGGLLKPLRRIKGGGAVEANMKIRSVLVALCAGALLTSGTGLPSFAAKSPAMEACSAQWAGMKKAGKTEGQTWPQFWSQCSKDYAAKNAGGAPAPEAATKPSKKAAAATVDESDSTGSGQQKKDCDAKWGAYKTKTGVHGWHDYFQFMAKCM
jgi:hypothetical protein